MAGMEQGKDIQGQNPKGTVFANLYPLIYAAETVVSGRNAASSLISATYVDAMVGLRGKRVLDYACGYGTTTMAIAAFAPKEITAFDNSASMTELMKVIMLGDNDLEQWAEEHGGREVLGELYEITIRHLKARRAEFRDGLFVRSGGQLIIDTFSALELTPGRVGIFDAVVANNCVHWPVNQLKVTMKKQQPELSDEELIRSATIQVFTKIAAVLVTGGAAVVQEVKDFLTLDDDSLREADAEAHTWVSHPVGQKMNAVFNHLLEKRYGIPRAMPKTTGLFRITKLRAWAASVGLELKRAAQAEYVYHDSVRGLQTVMPMWLGSVDIPFADKIRLIKEVAEEMRRTLPPEEIAPVRSQYFYLCFRKV